MIGSRTNAHHDHNARRQLPCAFSMPARGPVASEKYCCFDDSSACEVLPASSFCDSSVNGGERLCHTSFGHRREGGGGVCGATTTAGPPVVQDNLLDEPPSISIIVISYAPVVASAEKFPVAKPFNDRACSTGYWERGVSFLRRHSSRTPLSTYSKRGCFFWSLHNQLLCTRTLWLRYYYLIACIVFYFPSICRPNGKSTGSTKYSVPSTSSVAKFSPPSLSNAVIHTVYGVLSLKKRGEVYGVLSITT
jgi:hypothetical protein